jgi:hypothetical protein
MIEKTLLPKRPKNEREHKMSDVNAGCACKCLCVCGQQEKSVNTSNKSSNSQVANEG